MRAPLTQVLDEWSRRIAPFAVTVVLVLVAVMRVPVPGFADVAPMLPVMAVFYWTLYRPDLLPHWAVFAIGILVDALSGSPLGFNALLLLLACAFVRTQRRYLGPKNFLLHWLAFVVVVTAFEVLRWVLMSALNATLIALGPPALRVALAIAIYPCVSWFLLRVHQAFLKQV